MSQVDQKRAFNKLKHDLEPWRNLIISVDSVLTWERPFYPGIICASISALYLLLWLLDLSSITLLALAGLIAVAIDFVYPSVSRFLFNPDNWSGSQESHFENVCGQLCTIKRTLSVWYEYLFTAKERKSTVFVIIMSISLLALAWLGAVINNLLLMYTVTLVITLFPGVKEKRVFTAVKEKFGCVVNSKLQTFRKNSNKTD